MRICVVGATRLGLSSAVVLAEHGHGVKIWDSDPDVRVALAEGKPHFAEPGLKEAYARLWGGDGFKLAPSLAEGVKRAAVVMVCVTAPTAPDGGLDVSVLQQAVLGLEAALRDVPERPLIVVRTPVPPGTIKLRIAPLCPPGRFVFMPDLGAPGRYLEEARMPQRIVVGGDIVDTRLAIDLFKSETTEILTDLITAEVIGLAAQAFVAVKRGFAGEITALCDQVAVDPGTVFAALALDDGIAAGYLGPSPAGGGAGGVAAATMGASLRTSPLLDAAQNTTGTRGQQILIEAEAAFGNLAGRSIAVLGLAVAPGTDAVEDGVALEVIAGLLERGALVSAFDPLAMRATWEYFPRLRFGDDAIGALQGAEGAILLTPGPDFASLAWGETTSVRWIIDASGAIEEPPTGLGYRQV